MTDRCFGYEKIKDGHNCVICKAKEIGNKDLIFYSYENGNVWFDLTKGDKKLPDRINQNFHYKINTLDGLHEALSTLSVYPQLRDYQKEFDCPSKFAII